MPRKKKAKPASSFIAVLITIIIVGVVSVYFWISFGSKPVSDDIKKISFIVSKGETVDSIGASLKEVDLIRSPAVFKFIVLKMGIAENIQAGSFSLSPSLDTSQIASSLTSGRQDFWVTILEGWRREETAQYLETTFKSAGATFDKQVFLAATTDKEGMLFPETYLFPLGVTEETVASILVDTFNSRVDKNVLAIINSQGSTLGQVITLASLVEREARTDKSRRVVAGILQNRLDIGMALQVDATLQYVKGYSPIHKEWWATPLAADKDIDSPYNTYKYASLPPGPICSPSLSSIQAVINPTPSNYLYYITDNSGGMHYSQTFEQHNQNVNTYLR